MQFIKRNALAFCFAATSLLSDELRSFAYAILHKFLKKLEDLSEEDYEEKYIYIYIIRLFKNSIENINERVHHGKFQILF